jgi:hypothetical protein
MRRRLVSIGLVAAALAAGGCGKKDAPAPSASEPAPIPATEAAAPAESGAAAPTAATGAWTPEALEELLAPIAIYPDVVLGHVLSASTNPQEVLDAGNWLLEHQDLTGSALDEEAEKLGFSPSMRALLQFPEAVDMMCMRMDWTTQLGQAFTADQGAVLDAVQRLRQQAQDVGNLESSPQLKVETEKQEDKEIVTVKPADPQVVYVPKYDPAAVYAPPPATIPPPTTINITPASGTTVTTTSGDQVTTTTAAAPPASTTTTEDKGHSTGALITTGLLAFGAGILVNEVFDDDDDWDDYYPNYWHGGMYYGPRPYYPPPPYMYRPPYGPGFYPANNYVRPVNYQHGFNNNTIIVNNGGNDYWNRYNKNSTRVDARPAKSPITAARPNRPELATLNQQAREKTRTREQVATRDAPLDQTRQTGYAGARPENKAARDRMVQNSPKPPGVAPDLPKRPTGTYAGATNRPAAAKDRPAAAPKPGAAGAGAREPPKQRPAGAVDRGYERPEVAKPAASRPDLARDRPSTPSVAQSRPDVARERPAAARPTVDRPATPAQRPDRTAFQTNDARPARAEHAASQRGRTSMPSGARGGGQKPRR